MEDVARYVLSQERVDGVRLDIGTYDASAVDLSLPAEVPWVIGRSYNGRQETSGSAARHSEGYQGQDWFQSSQPEIVYFDGATDADDLADFIAGYFSMPPAPLADWDRNGITDPDDLADYIAAYFAGC